MRRLSIMVAMVLAMALCASTAFADKLQEVKDRGVLICGVKDAVVPFGYIDETTKKLVGMDIDVCNYIAKQLGVKTEFKPVTSSTRIAMLAQGSIDLAAATMTHKIARDDTIDFSITYFMDGQKLLVKKGSGIKSAADLKGQKIGTAKGSTSEQNILAAQPDCKVLSFEGYPQAFLALKQGKVKAVTTDSTILLGLKNSDPNPSNWEIVGDFISPEPYGLGLPENESNFRDAVNFALIEMWKSGDYKKIYDRWFGADTKYALPLTWQMEIWP
ncbi:polar amino acid transport system substrate-binding protein [Maridesulfovibrio ferrireducens]|uniref:Polar amino acid transport system substrate-binding protein n=1 Tax=Maridesulfovibrio ferrireducens TaxID=246191 RepID=A0A1G9EFX6_9BACT|nr:ABC transporter substrate-binding protein [Maridesulfovibrio ferrireducens]SDK74973.1 polar amino acid transport system substrate-binding protein [Maridesulfovibrio ferrireducens]